MNSNFFPTNLDNLQPSNNYNINFSNSFPRTRKYWCHICRKDFSHNYEENMDIKCIYCGRTFCELLDNEDTSNESHPIHFEPFILNSQNNNINLNNIPPGINFDNSRRRVNRIFDFISNYYMLQDYNDNLDNIINQIMLNDTNKYGNPPAAKKAIEKLKKYKINKKKIKEFGFENSCSVCKDEFNIGEECLAMPCNHYFHRNCLLPWLKERNSCPVCRYELPTDDPDFEKMKKKLKNGNNRISNENL